MVEELFYENIGNTLIKNIPEFTSIYKEHLKDNGEILPHVLLGDFTRFVINTYRQSLQEADKQELLKRCLDLIERLLLSNDKRLGELVQVSFLENLHQAGADYEKIKKFLRPKSLEQLLSIENWKLK